MLLDPKKLTPDELKQAARNVRKTFYWEKKDLPTYVVVTKHLLATAIENHKEEGEHHKEFGSRVLGLGYDLASMTWPGWDEEGIDVTEELRKIGLEASKLIVEFGTQQGVSDESLHDLYWMLGAHLLTDGNSQGAREAWERASELHAHSESLGMKAWIQLSRSVESGNQSELENMLEKLEAADKPLPDTAAQIRTAMNVLAQKQGTIRDT